MFFLCDMAKSFVQKSLRSGLLFLGVLHTTDHLGLLLRKNCLDPDQKTGL